MTHVQLGELSADGTPGAPVSPAPPPRPRRPSSRPSEGTSCCRWTTAFTPCRLLFQPSPTAALQNTPRNTPRSQPDQGPARAGGVRHRAPAQGGRQLPQGTARLESGAMPPFGTQKREAFSANTLCQNLGALSRRPGLDGAISHSMLASRGASQCWSAWQGITALPPRTTILT